MKKYRFFTKQFENTEPEIFNALKKIKDREFFLISGLAIVTILVFILQLFLPIGLKIALLVSAIWLMFFITSLLIFPSFIAALKAFPKSHTKKYIMFFLVLNVIFVGNVVYMIYSSIPFFLGGLNHF